MQLGLSMEREYLVKAQHERDSEIITLSDDQVFELEEESGLNFENLHEGKVWRVWLWDGWMYTLEKKR